MRRLLMLAALGSLVPCAWGDTQVGPTMQTTWGCGRIVVTIRVYKDIPSLPGLYRWDYDVTNVSIPLLTHECGFTELSGLTNFGFVFPQEIPELQNVTVPAGWTYSVEVMPAIAGLYQPVTILWVGYSGEVMDASMQIGETAHFSFTTLPRPAVNLNECETVEEGGLGKLAGACGNAGTGGVQECLITPGTSAAAPPKRGRPAFVSGARNRRTRDLEQRMLAASCDDLTGGSYAPGPRLSEIEVASISFAGVSLRIDSAGPEITAPHWILDTKAKPPSAAPYDSGTSAPAAFLKSQPLTFQAQFKSNVPDITSCSIEATLSPTNGVNLPWGNIDATTVTFTNGSSGDVSFTVSEQSPSVGAIDLRMDWRVVSCQPGGSLPVNDLPLVPTRHRIYSLWKQPVAPQVQPWVKVLEISSPMLSEIAPTDTDEKVVEALADRIFYSRWTGYDLKFTPWLRAYKYDPNSTFSCGDDTQQTIELQVLLDKLVEADANPLKFQCNDNSNLHAILAASQGIAANPTFIHDNRTTMIDGRLKWVPIQTALHQRAGETGQCHQDQFYFHQVASLEQLDDTSVRSATGSTSSCAAGPNFFGLSPTSYFSTVFPTQQSSYTSFTRPTVVIGACQY
jgi:hypothetical protein